MPDYLQGKIYTIRCKTDNTLIYVGSTTQSLSMRMAGHRKEIYNETRKQYTKKSVCCVRCAMQGTQTDSDGPNSNFMQAWDADKLEILGAPERP
ncbi:MAG: GIY-YIG nuclease family protein [bacterium]